MPLLMRNMAPTVITAGLAKPDTASIGVKILVKMRATMIPMAVRSMGILSVISRKRANSRMMETIRMSIKEASSEHILIIIKKY
jgi:hypothetical protein